MVQAEPGKSGCQPLMLRGLRKDSAFHQDTARITLPGWQPVICVALPSSATLLAATSPARWASSRRHRTERRRRNGGVLIGSFEPAHLHSSGFPRVCQWRFLRQNVSPQREQCIQILYGLGLHCPVLSRLFRLEHGITVLCLVFCNKHQSDQVGLFCSWSA